eukprot:TRINITY_DN6853_c0_g2_i1.p1 TRINITY_DN6853_c0_g2~~TRINITY_DN6853_c0_g2_i1.p1  ORF type:complete len:318 (+),score=77.89 TRINITY_DN6853_c0_g2_i1:352-1305(+)
MVDINSMMILQQKNNKNVKVVSDNMTNNILLYSTPQKDINKFYITSSYPESIKKLDKQIAKYKYELQKSLVLQQIQEQQYEDLLKMQDQLYKEQQSQNQQRKNPENPNNFEFLTGLQAPEEEFKDNALKKSNEFPIQEQPQFQEKNTEEQQKLNENKQNYVSYNNSGQEKVTPIKKIDVKQAYEKSYKIYQNEISKLFLEREIFPKKPRKKKNPKLQITTKNNSLDRVYAVDNQIEHKMRVYNHEHIPSKPQVLIPTFSTRRDKLSQNVLAYMQDYRPLIEGRKELLPKQIVNLIEDEAKALKSQEIFKMNMISDIQ